MARHGLDLQILSGNQARELEPALNRRVVGALYSAEDAHGNSHRFVTGLGEALGKHGVAVREGAEVTGWLLEGGRPAGVRTEHGDFRAREIVLATGAWTPLLARELGVRVPVQAGKGYSLTMDRPAPSPKIPFIHAERKVAVTPIGNRLRFAGTMEFAGIDLSLNPTRTEAIRRGALEVMSGSDNPANVERWCGLRPCTPDGLPIIDRLPRHPNVYLSTGHAMLGYTHGPISGKLMAEMICGESTSLSLEPLRLGRF
jgi:D-amino-acid dehydrogenase